MLFPPSRCVASASRVAVTGAGIITAHGAGWRANARAFREGQCSLRPVTLFDVSRQRARLAGEADLPERTTTRGLSKRALARLDRAALFLLFAADEAWAASGWTTDSRLPLVLGTTSAGMPHGEDYYRQALSSPFGRRRQVARAIHYQAQRQALALAAHLDAGGPITIISNACASGANALGQAFELIRSGQADRVLAGGYEGLCQMVFAGFDSLQALSTTTCRPFDAGRDGLVLGEGAAVFALESWTTAQARGATILGEVAGYGATTDIHHLTQPHPEGEAAWAAMRLACADAGVTPSQIDYLNAHGTGTRLNDASEAAAINRWAEGEVARVPVSSTKAGIGHLLGAAGAVEAAISLMALQGQWLPPTTTCQDLDPACRFPFVRQATDAPVRCVMSNSFGFGGANASLVFRRAP